MHLSSPTRFTSIRTPASSWTTTPPPAACLYRPHSAQAGSRSDSSTARRQSRRFRSDWVNFPHHRTCPGSHQCHLRANARAPETMVSDHGHCDQQLADSGLGFVLLQPNWFYQKRLIPLRPGSPSFGTGEHLAFAGETEDHQPNQVLAW